MPYLSCKKIENDVYNFPTWQYCKYKDIFDSRIIINSTAKFYISISYHKDLLSIDTRIFTPSNRAIRACSNILVSSLKKLSKENQKLQISYGETLTVSDLKKILYLILDYPHKHYTFKHFEV